MKQKRRKVTHRKAVARRPKTRPTRRPKRKSTKRWPLHKRFLLHPITLFILLCLGVLMVGVTYKVISTDNVTATVRIPAPPLTEAATITDPLDQSHHTFIPIDVTGTCPDDSYVKLYRNGVFSGTDFCVANQWQITTDLDIGENVLLPRVYNLTDSEGPAATAITVYYDPPPPIVSETPSNDFVSVLEVQTENEFATVGLNEEYDLVIDITGGYAPFVLEIHWGDNSSTTVMREAIGTFTIQHIYVEPPPNNLFYTIQINCVDVLGVTSYLQLAVISDQVVTGGGNNLAGATLPTSHTTTLLAILWPAYLVVVLMTISFYLGEREEYYLIFFRRKNKRRRYA